jgi:hypothetical protein
MGIKLKKYETSDGLTVDYMFWCPGCKHAHPFRVRGKMEWQWNGSLDKPTFDPSLLVYQSDVNKRCHSFVKNGMIQFLGDCGHELKGKTVEIPDWDDDRPW